MRRTLKTFFTGTLLLACIASAVLWVRTASTISLLRYYGPSGPDRWVEYRFVSTLGRIGFWRTGGERQSGRQQSPALWEFKEYATPPRSSSNTMTWGFERSATADDSRVQLIGFQVYDTRPAGGGYASQQGAFVPYWFILLVTGGWGMRRAWRAIARRRQRSKPHRCVQCGYDLTGTLALPRCPECGTTREPGVTAV